MATKQLFQILLKNRDGIKKGITKVQDIVTEYLSTTGARTISPDERFTINKEFSELAPSNVVDDVFGDFQGLQDDAADAVTDTPFTDKVSKQMGTKLRGDETFGEIMEMKESDQGLASLFPRSENAKDFIFDQKYSNRKEVADFMRAMRGAGIKNEDVMGVIKDKTNFKRQPAYDYFGSDKPKEVVDLAEGKRAATSLARAAEMKADTAIKQELLANLDEDIATRGPDWWRGTGFEEGPMGRESVGNLLESITTDINNGVIDDLIARGMDEDKVFDIMRYMGRDVRERLKYDPKGFIQKVTEELEFNDIKYDMTFWDNYTDKILTRIQKPEPRFADGGLV